MPVQVEVDPGVRTPPLRTPQNAPVKRPRRGEVVDRKGEVEGRQAHPAIIAERDGEGTSAVGESGPSIRMILAY